MNQEPTYHRLEPNIHMDRYLYLSPSEILDEQKEIEEATRVIRAKYDALAKYRKEEYENPMQNPGA